MQAAISAYFSVFRCARSLFKGIVTMVTRVKVESQRSKPADDGEAE